MALKRYRKGKLAAAALIIIAAAMLSSCSAMYDREFYLEEKYVENYVPIPDTDIIEVYNINGMRGALEQMVSEHADGGTIRTVNYSGKVNDDISMVIDYMRTEFPLGNYAVEYINQNPKAFLSYYEIDIEINYKRSLEEVAAIEKPIGSQWTNLIDQAMQDFEKEVTFETGTMKITEVSIVNYAEEYYSDSSEELPVMPEITVVAYPNMVNLHKIITVRFDYPYSEEVLEMMRLNAKWEREFEEQQSEFPLLETESPGEDTQATEPDEPSESVEPSEQDPGAGDRNGGAPFDSLNPGLDADLYSY